MTELISMGTSYFFGWTTHYQTEGPYELMKCFTFFLSQHVLLSLVLVKDTSELLCNCSVNYIGLLSRNLFLTFALFSSPRKSLLIELWSGNFMLDLCLDLFVSRFGPSLGNTMEFLL